jgi:hypothetical protein
VKGKLIFYLTETQPVLELSLAMAESLNAPLHFDFLLNPFLVLQRTILLMKPDTVSMMHYGYLIKPRYQHEDKTTCINTSGSSGTRSATPSEAKEAKG